MHLALDLTCTTLTQGGTAVYAKALLKGLREEAVGVSPIQFSPWFGRDRRLGRKVDTLRREAGRLSWVQRGMEAAARRAEADVVHAPTIHGPFRRSMGGLGRVLTVHDLNPLHYPEMYPAWHLRSDLRHLRRSLVAADELVTVSEFTRGQVLELLPSLDPERVTTIYHGVDPRFCPASPDGAKLDLADRYGLDGAYVLSVSTLSPNKNAEGLLRAWRAIADEVPEVTLVFAGSPGWKGRPLMDVARELGIAERVLHLGFVPDADLAAVYRQARAFALPSLSEGFGMPVAEAMASGVPVLTSTTSSLPEVAGEAAVRVDPRDDEAIAEGVLRLLTDEALRADLRARGLERVTRFTWEESVRRHVAIYQRAAKKSHG